MNITKNKSVFSEAFKPNYLKKSSSELSFPKYSSNDKVDKIDSNKNRYLPPINNNSTTNFNFYNNNKQNNYKKFCDLRNTIEFHSFSRNKF